jgi:hypothetical protein
MGQVLSKLVALGPASPPSITYLEYKSHVNVALGHERQVCEKRREEKRGELNVQRKRPRSEPNGRDAVSEDG